MHERAKLVQFRIRALLILTAAVGACLGVRRIPEDVKVMAILCASGIVVVAWAFLRHRLWLAIAGCMIIAGAIPVQMAINAPPRDDKRMVEVAVSVLDASTGRGIPNAYVGGGNEGAPEATTDVNGRATLAWRLVCWQSAPEVFACADQYNTTSVDIAEKIDAGVSEDRYTLPVVIRLEREQTANSQQPRSSAARDQLR